MKVLIVSIFLLTSHIYYVFGKLKISSTVVKCQSDSAKFFGFQVLNVGLVVLMDLILICIQNV